MASDTVPCKVEDHLDQDPPLRGQNYVCLSFISPEDVIKRKEAYFFENFLSGFSHDMTEFLDNLGAKYPGDTELLKSIKDRYSYVFDPSVINEEYDFFRRINGEKLETDFFEKNNFQTTIRGLKVRGIFDTRKEAEIRAQVLKKLDDKFNVYVAEVGCWLPWSPNPDEITEQEFAETQLNTLMKKYKENQLKKDLFFQERLKETALDRMREQLEKPDAWEQANVGETTTEEAAPAPAPAPVPVPAETTTTTTTTTTDEASSSN